MVSRKLTNCNDDARAKTTSCGSHNPYNITNSLHFSLCHIYYSRTTHALASKYFNRISILQISFEMWGSLFKWGNLHVRGIRDKWGSLNMWGSLNARKPQYVREPKLVRQLQPKGKISNSGKTLYLNIVRFWISETDTGNTEMQSENAQQSRMDCI